MVVFLSFDTFRLKSNPNTRSRSKSIITRKFVTDFYRFPIIVDCLVSTFIDNERFLSTIGIIDMLLSVYLQKHKKKVHGLQRKRRIPKRRICLALKQKVDKGNLSVLEVELVPFLRAFACLLTLQTKMDFSCLI